MDTVCFQASSEVNIDRSKKNSFLSLHWNFIHAGIYILRLYARRNGSWFWWLDVHFDCLCQNFQLMHMRGSASSNFPQYVQLRLSFQFTETGLRYRSKNWYTLFSIFCSETVEVSWVKQGRKHVILKAMREARHGALGGLLQRCAWSNFASA